MPRQTDVGFDESIVVRFDGSLAADGQLLLSELAQSLHGWDRFLRLSTVSLLRQRLSGLEVLPGATLEIRAYAVRRGSFEILLLMAVSGIVGNAAWAGVKRLWPFVQNVYQTHLEAKRERLELETAAERLRSLAEYSKISAADQDDDTDDAIAFTSAVDESLAQASLPLSQSADKIDLIVEDASPVIEISRADRVLLRVPYSATAPVRPAGQLQRRRIKLLGLNIHNGWGRFEFEEPEGPGESRQQECKVVDRALFRPHNIYTRSMDDRAFIEVDMKVVVREDSPTGSYYWIIFGPNSVPEGDLF